MVELAHDLRSPLTSILFLGETMKRGRSGPVTPLQERQLGLIYSAAFGLSSVASDVIELARGGDRLVDLEPLPFSVADIIESVRDIVQPIAEEKGLEVRLVPCERTSRMGHPVALSRILLNLTTNALKFTDDGRVEVTCTEVGDLGVEFRCATPVAASRRRPWRCCSSRSAAGRRTATMRFRVGPGLDLPQAGRGDGRVASGGDRPGQGTRFYFKLDLPLAAQPERS